MKISGKIGKSGYLTIIVLGAALLNGCAVYSPTYQASLPVDEIVKMSKEGVSSKDIITDIRRSHSVYTLRAADLAALRDEGVQDSVINYMEKTHMDAIRRDERMSDFYYGYPGGYGYPYWGFNYGYPYYWGWGFGPTIIVRHGYDGYHGGYRSSGIARRH
ncbi:MAG: hypothetical protein Q8868_03600 [Bacteroidota bacterium]|nr:hypothetical protein [Bacteroidota bacterium]